MSRIKHNNPKVKQVNLKKPIKKMFRKPLDTVYIIVDDPNYDIDEIFACY